MQNSKTGPRAEYRLQEAIRVKESQTMAEKFKKLKGLTASLAYYGRGDHKTSEVKYSVNLTNTRSVFRFNCQNHECVRGDYDLTEQVAKAVADREDDVSGELHCKGHLTYGTESVIHCSNVLRYKLSLQY